MIHFGDWTYWVTEKKWPPIYSQDFQIPCIVWEWLHFDSKFTEIFRGNLTNERLWGFRFNNFLSNVPVMPVDIYPALLWRHTGHKDVSNHQPHDCLLNRSFRRRSNKTLNPRITDLCAGNSPVTGEFPAQMASKAEDISIWWRHHEHGTVSISEFKIILIKITKMDDDPKMVKQSVWLLKSWPNGD